MAVDIYSLETRYLDSCKKQEVLPNSSILLGISKVKIQKARQEFCCLEVFLDQLKDVDFPPLIELFAAITSFEIDAVDILNESSRVLFNGAPVSSLIHVVGQKLRIVDLQDLSFGKDFLRDLLRRGLTCQILNLRSSHIRKLNMNGNFMQLHTLNLDFSISLTSFREGCFSCMPNLMRLSMCETRISNLWTTSAALSKLPSLVELRFQNCLCCNDTGPCQASSGEKSDLSAAKRISSGQLQLHPSTCVTSIARDGFLFQNYHYSGTDDMFTDMLSDDDSFTNHELFQSTSEELSDDSELDFPSQQQESGNWFETFLIDSPELRQTHQRNSANMDDHAIPFGGSSSSSTPFWFSKEAVRPNSEEAILVHETREMGVDYLSGNYLDGYGNLDEFCNTSFYSFGDKERSITKAFDSRHGSMDRVRKKYISHHPSPICFEKHYREYMVASLPHLKVLDNLLVEDEDRETAKMIVSQHYECLPYNRLYKENVVSLLQNREMGTGSSLRKYSKKLPYSSERSQYSFTRSMSASKIGCSAWPRLHPISKLRSIPREESRKFRPRQFEYHPSNPGLMVFGTLDGELAIINHESEKLVGFLSSVGALHSVLGLCWLKKYPSKLVAGSDNGSLHLYDISQMPSTFTDRCYYTDAAIFSFDEFDQLTSVHVNSTDEYFLVSGYSKHVALYDIGSGRRLQVFKDLHREHINVVKFAHHSPSIFATSSFDQEVKMWDLRQGVSQLCYTTSSSRGNVMVCFSPDDHYLLSSAVDNEVKQLLAVDGRLHMKFNIAPTGSAQNYTRSYYMNGRDYIISGSCEENVVRICCAQTGRRLRDISLEGRGSKNSMFVQSLRGDPFRDFHFSVLAAYPSSKSEIIKVQCLMTQFQDPTPLVTCLTIKLVMLAYVKDMQYACKINLLASGDFVESSFHGQNRHPSHGMGG